MAKKKKKTSELPLGDGPGVGRVNIPELDDLALNYERIRNRRVDLTLQEVKAKEALNVGLKKHEAALGRAPDGGIHYVFENSLSKTGLSVASVTPAGEQTKVSTYSDPGEPE